MSRWISDAVPCQGCSPEIICNGHWSKTLSNYWHVMLNPIRFSYPLLAIPEDSLIRLSHSWWLRQQSVSLQCSRPRFNPWLGRSPGEGNGNPLQYSCLENSMVGGAWWATVHGVAKSQTRLSDFTYSLTLLCIRIYTLEKEDCSSRRAGYFLTEKDHGLLGSK